MRAWAPLAVLAVLAILLAVGLGEAATAGPSVDARGGEGYRGLYRVLEARGGDVSRWTGPVTELPAGGTFVVASPLHRPYDAAEASALALWVARGGHLVLLPDGSGLPGSDGPLLTALELARVAEEIEAPLGFGAWRAWTAARERRTSPTGLTLRATDDRRAVACPPAAEVLYARPDGAARVCTWSRRRGRVTLVNDASVWSNGRLGEADHLAFAVDVLGEGPVRFDELHHGAGAAATSATSDLGPVPDALLLHAVGLYAIAAWSLSRPFGARVRPRDEPRAASTRELLALAELHRRGRHAQAAGERLLRIVRARLERRGEDPDVLPTTFHGDERALVELAARVGRLQGERRV